MEGDEPHQVGATAARLWSLGDAAVTAGVSLSAGQTTKLRTFRDLLLEWNIHTNLTAITDPTAVERRLILDALRMIPTIDAFSDGSLRLADVGSGAGFPGLVLHIARPGLGMTLIEATGKKVAFLRHVIATLDLTGIEAIHARAEEIGRDPAYRAQFDLVTARAVASLPALLELCLPLLRTGGRALFPKSLGVGEELATGKRVAPLLGGRVSDTSAVFAALEIDDIATQLVAVDKVATTPDRFPRRAGLPASAPLGGAAT